MPPDFNGTNTTAEIRIHPSGRFLYNTNRGHNSVTMFEIEPDTGELEVIGWESTRGEWPRGMNIDPSGTFLYNQGTDLASPFRSGTSLARFGRALLYRRACANGLPKLVYGRLVH